MKVGYTGGLPDAVDHEKGVSRYVRELGRRLPQHPDIELVPVGRWRVPSDIDVLHITAPRVAYAPLLRADVPTVVSVHALDLHWPPGFRASIREPKAWAQQRLIPRLYDDLEGYITVSRFLKDELLGAYDIEPERIHPVYHGVADRFRQAGLEATPDGPLLTSTPKPAVADVLEAVHRAGHERELVVFSERGYGDGEFRQLIDHYGLGDAVDMRGYVTDEELADLYAEASLYLHWGQYEGFGLPPIEALASGTPVITNDAGSLPEVVDHGGVVANGRWQAVEAARGLLEGEMPYLKAVIDGRVRASEFTWGRTAADTVAVYRAVAKR